MSKRLVIVAVTLVMVVLASACAGGVDASKSRAEAVIQSGGVVSSDELRVDEYLGYYQQSFPAPVNATLGLDLRLGNLQTPVEGGEVWLQIGIQARKADVDPVAPLNLAIVIDKSGSMDAPEKMPFVKQALGAFLHGRSPSDLVALVAFDDQVEVLRPAAPVGDGAWINGTVDRLQPGGSTNLNAGLLAGFQEVDRNFDVRRNNRVVLLTDGVANQGVTDPDQIASMARAYNEKGIYLSTIGLGREEFNDALLIRLADQGKGAYHFLNSAADLDRFFSEGVAGLVQKAASGVAVTIFPEQAVTVEGLTGYDGRPHDGPIQVRLRDMGTGDSQVVLARLHVAAGPSGTRRLATVQLDYQDAFAKRSASLAKPVDSDSVRVANYDPTWDTEVLRNVTIQRTVEGLKQIDTLYHAQRYLDAWRLAKGLEQDLRSVAQLTGDSQMVKDADTMRTYENTLSNLAQRQSGSSPSAEGEQTTSAPLQRAEPVPAPSVTVVEIR